MLIRRIVVNISKTDIPNGCKFRNKWELHNRKFSDMIQLNTTDGNGNKLAGVEITT